MSELDERLASIAKLRETLRQYEEGEYAARVGLTRARQRLQRAKRGEILAHDQQDPQANVDQLEAVATRNAQAAKGVRADLSQAIGGIYVEDPHPRRTTAQLPDSTPFLLMPVRLETVFQGQELWVRVFPDDIAVHTHEPTLTDTEVDAGQLYWTELLVAAHLRRDGDARRADAWRHIVDLFGGQRAAWIAQRTQPTDWAVLDAAAAGQSLIAFLNSADAALLPSFAAESLTTAERAAFTSAIAAGDGDAFFTLANARGWNARVNIVARGEIAGFPVLDVTKSDSWSRAPRTNVLPDRFVLMLYDTETSVPAQVTGALIDETVFVGPDPLAPKDSIALDASGVRTFVGNCQWLADFPTAVAKGLGFKVPLTQAQAANGFARILVLGLKISAGATGGGEMLEELIGNHQYSPSGFSLVRQGTPTNNTERDGSGYSDNDPYDDLAFYTPLDAPAFDPASNDARRSDTDGRRFADALGISYTALESVQGAEHVDGLEAKAMNTALFPSTLGYWLTQWMAPMVGADTARLTRQFFTHYVSGRGPLPAIRVGDQPYGVLVTSDMTRWKYPQPSGRLGQIASIDEWTPFLRKLTSLLQHLEKTWQGHVAEVSHVAKTSGEAPELLMDLLGLHPTSVEFFQRIGFHQFFVDDYARFLWKDTTGHPDSAALASLIASLPATMRLYLQSLGISETIADIKDAKAMNVLWQHYVSGLPIPSLVQKDPASEDAPLAANYIQWLHDAETADIQVEKYPGAAPAAMLYLMLRNALLLQLGNGAYQWLQTRSIYAPSLESALQSNPLLGVVPSTPPVSKIELMSVKVAKVVPAYAFPNASVADVIWGGPTPAEAEAAFVQEQRDALAVLAPATTASLERCLVEHLDCCQYRLDAWETGLFTQRLLEQRQADSYLDRTTGVYLGAFGWVENVRPLRRTTIKPDALPESLRPPPEDKGMVFEEDEVPGPATVPANAQTGERRGGFTQAPSINHAAAAALLRNAYLTHSDSADADVLSNNLSSDRARRAQFVLEGMRNGQPIEALLGYQFERALHDRTSSSFANHDSPVLELNEFIQPYREAFPFGAFEIPQAGTGPAADSVPPFSVVNGLSLISATLDSGNGFGLSGIAGTPIPDATQGAAILVARDSLTETLDAVKDLLTAENAYQLVQGNYDRVAAVSLAQKDARVPPELEVLDTPRGSRFTFTQRVTLQFEAAVVELADAAPWPGARTPRALAEPAINDWLGGLLGNHPENVGCDVSWIADPSDDPAPHDTRFVTLESLGIQPVDFVSLVPIDAKDLAGGSELEQRIARAYRQLLALDNGTFVRIDFGAATAAAPGQMTIAELLPLARRARGLIGECRALNAQDFIPAAGGKATTVLIDNANPGGYLLDELRGRVTAARDALTSLADALDGASAPNVALVLTQGTADAGDDVPFAGKLGGAFDTLSAAGVDFTDTAKLNATFAAADASSLADTLRAVADFGIADAFPRELDFADDGVGRSLLARAQRVARRLRRTDPKDGVLDRAGVAIDAAVAPMSIADQVTSLLAAAAILFGDSFRCLPLFQRYNDADVAAADADRATLLSYGLSTAPDLDGAGLVDEWLQGLACVRPRLQAFETLRVLGEALGGESLGMQPIQLPYRKQDRWLAVEFPEKDPLDPTKTFGISRDTISLVAHGARPFTMGVAQAGLLLDEWTEEIPTASENTGISFRYNQPNSVPPQTLLLAVTPEETGAWSWDELVGILVDTLGRAKRRAVEPRQLEQEMSATLPWNQLAPATVAEFSMVRPADVSLDYLLPVAFAKLADSYVLKGL